MTKPPTKVGGFLIFPMIEYYWTALYTKSRAEKKVALRLAEMEIEHYLPIQKTKVQWSDRLKVVEKVLIPGYIFARISEREYYDVLNIYGCVAYVRSDGKAARIRESQINSMKLLLDKNEEACLCENVFEPGQQVEITFGAFQGFVGEVVYKKNSGRLVVRIDQVGLCISLEVPLAHLEKQNI